MSILAVKENEPQNDGTFGLKTSQDKFHRGAFEVMQPVDKGHRSGLDALLIASALPEGVSGTLADLGAGAGVAGLAALNLNPGLDLLAIEKHPEMAECARRTALLSTNMNLRSRVKVLEADVTLSGAERTKAGLEAESVDYVIMNPPYNIKRDQPPRDPMKIEAFMMGEGGIDAWFRTASAIARQGAMMVLIYRTENLGEVLACSQGRFGGLEILPVHSSQNEPAKRVIVRGIRGSRAPMSIVPGFVVHNDDGSFTEEAEAIFDGSGRLSFGS